MAARPHPSCQHGRPGVPDLLLKGMPIVGPSLRSPFFSQEQVEPSLTLQHFLIGAPARRVQLC
eukprot:3439624-Amphidinium_carterae.1